MKVLAPNAKEEKVLFPKLFAGEYGAEISTLLTSELDVLHSSFYDGDLEAFIYQEQARGLDKRMTIIMTTGEAAMYRLKDKMPDGTIIGGRGSNGPLAEDTPINEVVPEDLLGPLQHAADLSGLPDGAVAARPEDRLREGGRRSAKKPSADEIAASVQRHRVRRPGRTREDGARRRPSGHHRTPPTAPTNSTSRRTSPSSSTSCATRPNALTRRRASKSDDWIEGRHEGREVQLMLGAAVYVCIVQRV